MNYWGKDFIIKKDNKTKSFPQQWSPELQWWHTRNKKTIKFGLGLRPGSTSPEGTVGLFSLQQPAEGQKKGEDKERSEKGKTGRRCSLCPWWLDRERQHSGAIRWKVGPKTQYQLRDSEKRRGIFRRKHIHEEAQGKAMLAVNVTNQQVSCWPQRPDPQHPVEELCFS